MKIEELEAEVLRLDTRSRARLAEKLLESLEDLSEEENARLWIERARRRDVEMDRSPDTGRSADEVFREAIKRLRKSSFDRLGVVGGPVNDLSH